MMHQMVCNIYTVHLLDHEILCVDQKVLFVLNSIIPIVFYTRCTSIMCTKFIYYCCTVDF